MIIKELISLCGNGHRITVNSLKRDSIMTSYYGDLYQLEYEDRIVADENTDLELRNFCRYIWINVYLEKKASYCYIFLII